MDIMDTARLNIKRHRILKGLRQQDMADKLHMNIRSYQSLENGETRLDLERLAQIAKELDTNMEDLISPDGVIINQEIKDTGHGSGFSTGNTYNYNIEKDVLDKLLAAKDGEIQRLIDEIKYLKEKIDQLLNK